MNGSVEPMLITVDKLRAAWEQSINRAPEVEFAEARQRNLRRHAIETGIIERLYDLDWGVTEALVAEGIIAEVAEREGGVSAQTLQVINDQLDALTYLSDAAREGRELSVFFIRELHQLITRHQPTYEAQDALSNIVQVPLPHGTWKTQPNHVRRSDGSLLEYTPPEHVQSQMERLIKLYGETEKAHPVVRAAWLHHRFIAIHPFADGNGRVARALTLLVLLKSRYAPLVVDRRNRGDYISALDAANDGDLKPLVHLFAQLEILALRAELERPAVITPASSSAIDIARAHTERILAKRGIVSSEMTSRLEELFTDLKIRVRHHLATFGHHLDPIFRALDPNTYAETDLLPSDVVLSLKVQGRTFVMDINLARIGADGAIAVKARAWVAPSTARGVWFEELPALLDDLTPTDTVTLLADDDLNDRWPEVEDFLDRVLAVAIDRFSRLLS